MYKNIIFTTLAIIFLSGCTSNLTPMNLLKFDELQESVANEDNIINNYKGEVLKLETLEDTESMSVVLPKENMTVRVKIKVANVEDVLYMNLVDSNSEFGINKLLRRVSSFDEVELNQDAWMFEPSIEKGVVTMQLYIPSLYLYKSTYNPKLIFSYKRSSRALQEMIQFNFIKQKYYVTNDDNGHEIPKYVDLETYCEETGKGVSEDFTAQIDSLNTNRISLEMIQNLRGICK